MNTLSKDERIERLLRQQSALAEFGSFAFREDDLVKVLNEASRVCAEGLGARFGKVCQYREATNDLLVVAGYGWDTGVVGHVISRADESSPQGRAFVSGQPVISNLVSSTPKGFPFPLMTTSIVEHHDVANEANDSQLLHPMSIATMQVLEVDELKVLADGGYSNAQAVAQCERDNVEVAAPIKRGAMSTDFFRPTQFTYDEGSDTIRCPAGETLRPSGKHTRNRAIRCRTSACKDCRLKSRCTPGVQRTIHRLFDQAALDRMEARIYADPSLMVTRRCTVEHPFGTIKRMSGGGRFLTRGLKAVKAEAVLSILAFNMLHAVNAFGAERLTRTR
jgi:hypothetical protein